MNHVRVCAIGESFWIEVLHVDQAERAVALRFFAQAERRGFFRGRESDFYRTVFPDDPVRLRFGLGDLRG